MASPRTAEEAPRAAVPAVVDALVRLAALAVTALGLGGTPLLLLGWFRPAPVAVVCGAVFVALEWAWRAGGPPSRRAPSRLAVVVTCLAVAGVAFACVANLRHAGQHVLVDGDQAVYAVTGQALARTGGVGLATHAHDVFGGVGSLNYAGAGFQQTSPSTVLPTFMHLLPEVLAVGSWTGGLSGLLHTVPVVGALGLLAVFVFGARLAGPLPSLVGTGALALLLPEMFFSRETFSELPSQLLVFAGLALLWDLTDADHPPRRPALGGLVAGLVLSASTIARIDANVYLLPILAYLAFLVVGAARLRPRRRRPVRRLAAGLLAGTVVATGMGALDLYVGSPVYRALQAPLLRQVWLALAGVVVLGLVALALRDRLAPALSPALHPRRMARLGTAAGALVLLLGAYGWWVRPHVEHGEHLPPGQPTAVPNLQRHLGLPVQPLRSYDELTLHWISWYVGPITLAAAILAVAWLCWRICRGRDPQTLPFLLLFVAATAVYVYRPSIIPVQFWAMRRFLPVTLPGLTLLAGWLAARLWAARTRLARPVGRVATAGLGAVVLLGAVGFPAAYAATNKLSRYTAYASMTHVTEVLCAALPPDAAVVLVGGSPVVTGFPQLTQAACGVPVAVVGGSTTTTDLQRVQAAAARSGRQLFYLSPTPQPTLAGGAPLPGSPTFHQIAATVLPTQRLTLMSRPDAIYKLHLQLWLAPAAG